MGCHSLEVPEVAPLQYKHQKGSADLLGSHRVLAHMGAFCLLIAVEDK